LKYLKTIIFTIIIIAGILFGTSNQQPAAVKFFTYTTQEYPLYLILLSSFILGAAAASLHSLASRRDLKSRKKLAEKRLSELEKNK
jgi:uncharacterized integral membrane protein